MKEVWNRKWKNVLIWVSGYLSIVAYAVVGGYAIVKSEDLEVKKTAKSVLIVTIIFAVASALLTIISSIGGLFDGYYNTVVYDIYRILNVLVTVVKIAVYALGIIFEFMKNETSTEKTEKAETVEEDER